MSSRREGALVTMISMLRELERISPNTFIIYRRAAEEIIEEQPLSEKVKEYESERRGVETDGSLDTSFSSFKRTSSLHSVLSPNHQRPVRILISHELQPSASLQWPSGKEGEKTDFWSKNRNHVTTDGPHIQLYRELDPEKRKGLDKLYRQALKELELMIGQGCQHDPAKKSLMHEMWYGLLSNPLASDRHVLDSLARRIGIEDIGDNYLNSRDDL